MNKTVYSVVQHDYDLVSTARDTTITIVAVHESLRRANRVMIDFIKRLFPELDQKAVDALDRDLAKDEEFFGGLCQLDGNWIRHDQGKLDFMRKERLKMGKSSAFVKVRVCVLESELWEGASQYKEDVKEEDSSSDDDTEDEDNYANWLEFGEEGLGKEKKYEREDTRKVRGVRRVRMDAQGQIGLK